MTHLTENWFTYDVSELSATCKEEFVPARDIMTTMHGQLLEDKAVDVLVYMAARELRRRQHGSNVRVVPTAVFRGWLDWTKLVPGTVIPETGTVLPADPDRPQTLQKGLLVGSDYVFFPWSERNHYSSVILCNASANSTSRAWP